MPANDTRSSAAQFSRHGRRFVPRLSGMEKQTDKADGDWRAYTKAFLAYVDTQEVAAAPKVWLNDSPRV